MIIFSGPSGVGKGTIVKRLAASHGFATSISCTTRPPREDEKDGREYFFVTRERFMEMAEAGEFLEYDDHFGNLYGTPKAFVEKQLEQRDVVLEIEVNGALRAKKLYPNAVLVMIVPPSAEELKKRLVARGTEDEESIDSRISRYRFEFSKKEAYDYVVVNDKLDDAVSQIEDIITKIKGGRT